MTLLEVDILLRGVPVYFWRRRDGEVYATAHDFSKYLPEKEKPIHTLRIPVETIPHGWTVDSCPLVAAKLAELSR